MFTIQNLITVFLLTILCVVNVISLVLDGKINALKIDDRSRKRQFISLMLLFSCLQLLVLIGQSESIRIHISIAFLFLFWPSFYFSFIDSDSSAKRAKVYVAKFYFSYVFAVLTLIDFFVYDLYTNGNDFLFLGVLFFLCVTLLYYSSLVVIAWRTIQGNKKCFSLLFISAFLLTMGMVLVAFLNMLKEVITVDVCFFALVLLLFSLVFLKENIDKLQAVVPSSHQSEDSPWLKLDAQYLEKKEKQLATKYVKSTVDPQRSKKIGDSLVQLPVNYFFDSTLTLEKLANTLDASKFEVSHLFSTQFHTNFNQYVNEIRVLRAQELLVHQDYAHLSVKDIGLEVGFSSTTSFYRAFKERHALPPQEYRRKENK
ncbi:MULTISPECIES: helix-turn-helix transcriptional regulator [unclassified Myroides]|uniref:helix-turn-helix transcriptional regulator n=1 Tax=unclassified Myroides TaxID=2642485 RepID=UPI003D2F588D